jgi:hypothetical protein
MNWFSRLMIFLAENRPHSAPRTDWSGRPLGVEMTGSFSPVRRGQDLGLALCTLNQQLF